MGLVFVRHAAPLVDPSVLPASWGLSADGVEAAHRLGDRLRAELSDPAVVTSAEPKAVQTGAALDLGPCVVDARLGEVERPWFEDQPSFRTAVCRYLDGERLEGWEPQTQAVTRFSEAVRNLPDETVVVTHGTVLTLWLATQVDGFDAPSFWADLRFPDAFGLGDGQITRC